MSRASCLLLALAVGCVEPTLVARTQVVVALYAEPELALTRIEVEVRDEAGSELVSQHAFEPLGELPLSFGVYQPAAGAGWFMLVARGFAGAQRVVEYRVIAQFVSGRTGLLSVTLASRCAGVFCERAPSESCAPELGRCVPITREAPELELVDAAVPSADAALPPSTHAPPVPPSSHGFASLGGRRGDGTITLSRDGFEQAQRMCTSDGLYCITGSLLP